MKSAITTTAHFRLRAAIAAISHTAAVYISSGPQTNPDPRGWNGLEWGTGGKETILTRGNYLGAWGSLLGGGEGEGRGRGGGGFRFRYVDVGGNEVGMFADNVRSASGRTDVEAISFSRAYYFSEVSIVSLSTHVYSHPRSLAVGLDGIGVMYLKLW